MTSLFALLAFAALSFYLWTAIKTKEIAIRAGARACAAQQVQFLDYTVEQRRLRLTLDPRKNPSWYRCYHFEFATNGEFRYGGKIEMYGQKVHSIQLDPFPEQVSLTHESIDH